MGGAVARGYGSGARLGSGPVNGGVDGSEEGALRIGQRVGHAKFGEGVVLQCEGQGERTRVQVNFARAGAKWLMLGYAKLQPLDS